MIVAECIALLLADLSAAVVKADEQDRRDRERRYHADATSYMIHRIGRLLEANLRIAELNEKSDPRLAMDTRRRVQRCRRALKYLESRLAR